VADLLYAVLLIGIFVVLALVLRGLEKLWAAPGPWPTSSAGCWRSACSSTCSSPWSGRRNS